MLRIRFHGRGGQGIKTAANILGSALFRAGLEVQDAPRYGAERRGAPIFAYVRADRLPVRERGPIARPDLVVVADDTLVAVPAAGVLQGLDARALLLVRSRESAATWQARLAAPGAVLQLPEETGSTDRADAPLTGAGCAGAAARLVGLVERETLAAAVRDEVGNRGAAVVESTLAVALAGFDAMTAHAGAVRERPASWEPPVVSGWIEMPADPAEISAPDIHATLTSERSPTGLWRTMRPVVDAERCNRCSWVCSTFCPDSAIRVEADRSPRIDYEHCKGCLVCVAVCPPHAIRAVPEHAEVAS